MKTLQEFLSDYKIPSFNLFPKKNQDLHLSGLPNIGKALYVAEHFLKDQKNTCLIAKNTREAEIFRDDIGTFIGDDNVLYFPGLELKPYEWRHPFGNVVEKRLEFLRSLRSGEPKVYIINQESLLERFASPEIFFNSSLKLKMGQEISFETIREKLMVMDFKEESMVENIGEFSIRGDILDIYPFLSENPLRIEFFGDEIESIREFNIFSQLSQDNVENIEILPMDEYCLTQDDLENGILQMLEEFQNDQSIEFMQTKLVENRNFEGMQWQKSFFRELDQSFLDLLGEDCTVFLDDDGKLNERADDFLNEFKKAYYSQVENGHFPARPEALYYDAVQIREVLEKYSKRVFTRLSWEGDTSREFEFEEQSRENLGMEQLEEFLTDLHHSEYKVYLISNNQGQADRLKKIVEGMNYTDVLIGHISSGFVFDDEKVALLTDHQIFNKFSRKIQKRKYKGGVSIPNFEALTRGDFVIHQDYGVGKYVGIKRIEVKGGHADCILLEFHGKDNLTIPIEDLQKLEKHISRDAEVVSLNKLGNKSWGNLKEKVKKKVIKIAQELVELYAKRQLANKSAFPEDSELQQEFEVAFEYDPTPDQVQATQDCKRDMESKYPMDRLVCGDVGFGKTEVAMRVCFKAICAKKQVAVIVPTTILAAQHYNSFIDRFTGWPVEVELLNRYRSAKEKKEVLQKLKDGKVDIVVGTHSLLAKSVEFQDLGLLIFDEEQKFGVKQKEQIRELRLHVDSLSMSATPIPRTLHLSLSGARDISLITTPPRNRIPIETRVARFDSKLMGEAIYRELNRGGQTFIVHDKVQNINELASQIEEWVPEAKIGVAHGQMNEKDLEQIMSAFINREFDVLISTTIIEAGIDVPNANTMIVHNAQNFGVSQLYQLRGRVGRSDVKAYAYLITPRDKEITDVAKKRLHAMEMFTDLGSGYQLALRDLELRGAGNLLGTQQSGHIAEIGYETYVKMIKEAVDEIKGNSKPKDIETKVEFPVDSFIPESYVEDGIQRIALYQKISRIDSWKEVEKLQQEFRDRFGAIPEPCKMLLLGAEARLIGQELGVDKIGIEKHLLVLNFAEVYKPKPEVLADLMEKCRRPIRFLYDEPMQAVIELNASDDKDKVLQSHQLLKDFV